MAKIDYVHEATDNFPAFTETIEVRAWGLGGAEEQQFYIGSGLNFQANGNLWLEMIYSLEGAQIFYTRNFLHNMGGETSAQALESRLNEVIQQGEGKFAFGDLLPETSLVLSLEKHTYQDENNEEKVYSNVSLTLSADTSAVFGRTGPGMRWIDIRLDVDAEEGGRFMHDLIHETDLAYQGKHPDPACFPEGSSEWPFVWQLNRQAYKRISEDYQESYFENPLLADAFDDWLEKLPPGGLVLDAGCGHGNPVIGRLLEKGFQVTGSDFSPEMLYRAGQQFPQVHFIQEATTTITDLAVYDGICSFNSMLYLDPIDFLNSICRLHHALKPGGLLFLYGFDNGPDWRGEPFSHRVGQWMWSWHYGIEEAAALLAEHGYFTVVKTCKVQVDPEEADRIAQELEKQKQEEEAYRKKKEENPEAFFLPFFKGIIERSPYAYVIIARRAER